MPTTYYLEGHVQTLGEPLVLVLWSSVDIHLDVWERPTHRGADASEEPPHIRLNLAEVRYIIDYIFERRNCRKSTLPVPHLLDFHETETGFSIHHLRRGSPTVNIHCADLGHDFCKALTFFAERAEKNRKYLEERGFALLPLEPVEPMEWQESAAAPVDEQMDWDEVDSGVEQDDSELVHEAVINAIVENLAEVIDEATKVE